MSDHNPSANNPSASNPSASNPSASNPGDSNPGDSPATPAGYAAALAELEAILGRLERSDVDVDVLAAEVQRAATLIAFCRDRIGTARLQIEQVVADLGDTA